ncbi:MAG TPA: HAD family hydrolase [Fimbriimonas sp.]|nr:HAD family hydrolase [Fimbriimonas sp.]
MPRRPSLSAFRAALFDVDGTLVDSLAAIVLGLGDTFETFGGRRPGDSEIRAMIGLPLTKQMGRYGASDDVVAEMIPHAVERMEHHFHMETLFEPAVECLHVCRRNGIKTALVTSKNTQELAAFMKRFTGGSAVDVVVCSSDVPHPKPAPDSALLACERLGVSPSECVFIGDSVFDLRCGRAAGMASVAVSYGAGNREALLEESPDLLFDSPEDLLAWAQEAFLLSSCPEKS